MQRRLIRCFYYFSNYMLHNYYNYKIIRMQEEKQTQENRLSTSMIASHFLSLASRPLDYISQCNIKDEKSWQIIDVRLLLRYSFILYFCHFQCYSGNLIGLMWTQENNKTNQHTHTQWFVLNRTRRKQKLQTLVLTYYIKSQFELFTCLCVCAV